MARQPVRHFISTRPSAVCCGHCPLIRACGNAGLTYDAGHNVFVVGKYARLVLYRFKRGLQEGVFK